MVLKLLTMSADDEKRPEIVTSLREGMSSIKDIASNFKKITSAEKSQMSSE